MINKKFKIYFFLTAIILAGSYFLISVIIGDDRFRDFKSVLNNEQRQFVKNYLFPYKFISQKKKII